MNFKQKAAEKFKKELIDGGLEEAEIYPLLLAFKTGMNVGSAMFEDEKIQELALISIKR